MKKLLIGLPIALVAIIWLVFRSYNALAQPATFQTHEYVTIRWSGRENTHLIRANGKVEMLGPLLARVSRPDRVDERSFLMNIAMNAVAKEGYEFAGMTSDEIVMKRATPR